MEAFNGFSLLMLVSMVYVIYKLIQLISTKEGREWLRKNW